MAAIDHSLTYRQRKIKNLPHKLRLARILAVLRRQREAFANGSYIDVGCSNGYLTNIIKKEFGFPQAWGVDHAAANLEKGRHNYPAIRFEFADLNISGAVSGQFDLVTCFETLEHVGRPEEALKTILALGKSEKSLIMLSVPVEIHFAGLWKFVAKRILYRYSLRELPGNVSGWKYFLDLLKGIDISKYRNGNAKAAWGTHFGFDYRIIDRYLRRNNVYYEAFNYFTTRFYLIKKQGTV